IFLSATYISKSCESNRTCLTMPLGLRHLLTVMKELPVRLTLRTLLAYLDDTLEPAQAKQIGQKVAESQVAQELIERIQRVLRHRKLAAPPLTGLASKLDPNNVAEYLDSVLPNEQLAEVEDILLNSDMHLAEVAACHQILTLFLGQSDD